MSEFKKEKLLTIITNWTEMEGVLEEQGTTGLFNYLASHYFEVIQSEIKNRDYNQLDESQVYDITVEIFHDLLKNQTQLESLNRNKGHLKGYFLRIIKCKLSQTHKIEEKATSKIMLWADKKSENQAQEIAANLIFEISYDVNAVLEILKKEHPKKFEVIHLRYFEEKPLQQIAELLKITENNVKQRLFEARKWLKTNLGDYHRLT